MTKNKKKLGDGVGVPSGMKSVVVSVLISGLIVVGAIAFVNSSGGDSSGFSSATTGDNVSLVGGRQIVEIRAKGGYLPYRSIAKADMPTVLRINTNGTFDCSAAVIIPSLGFSKILPQTGSTDIDLGVQPFGVLRGSCGMGMYPFEVEFQR